MTELYEKYPSAARSEIRSTLLPTLMMMGFAALFFIYLGLAEQTGLARVFEVGTGVLLLLVTRGLYLFRPWARWTTIAILSTFTIAALVNLSLDDSLFTPLGFGQVVVGFILWGSVLTYLVAAGKEFAVANSEWEPRSKRGLAKLAEQHAEKQQGDQKPADQ